MAINASFTKFNKKCELLEVKPEKPILDVPTRWNSTALMLKSVQCLFHPLIAMTQSERALKKYVIKPEEKN